MGHRGAQSADTEFTEVKQRSDVPCAPLQNTAWKRKMPHTVRAPSVSVSYALVGLGVKYSG
jgi:hypothetical protein